MNTKNRPVFGWHWVVVCLSILGVAACMSSRDSTTTTPIPTKTVSLRLEDGAVEVQSENKDWVPVGAETTFELVGQLKSVDPWMVTGNTFATSDSARIAEGLETDGLVQVKGVILKDGTWLANSIEPAEEQSDPAITLIGKVDSVDPWVVSGITLNVSDDTTIAAQIAPGMIVDVDILLLEEDGAWEVLSIAPLSAFTEIPGCTTVTATILSVNGNEVQFAGWPAIVLDEDVQIENESGKQTTLSEHPLALVVICAGEDGQPAITKIIVLKAGIRDTSTYGERVLVCHKPEKKGGHTLSVAAPAVAAHLAHGDKLGACP